MRHFTTDVVVSAYTNVLVCKFDEMRALLNYMTKTEVFLGNIPHARSACAAGLERQFPWLKDIELAMPLGDEPSNKSNGTPPWLRKARKEHKDGLEVDRLHQYFGPKLTFADIVLT